MIVLYDFFDLVVGVCVWPAFEVRSAFHFSEFGSDSIWGNADARPIGIFNNRKINAVEYYLTLICLSIHSSMREISCTESMLF